jgi:hypothetical protein
VSSGSPSDPLSLHQRYLPADAIAACGGGARLICRGQVALLPQDVLWFVTLDAETRFRRPSELTWRPSGLFVGEVPDELREGVAVLCRLPTEEDYLYVGWCGLDAGFRFNAPTVRWIRPKLPAAEWLRLGGTPGLRCAIDGTEADRGALLAALDRPSAELTLGRLEDDDLLVVHVNETQTLLRYFSEPGSDEKTSCGAPAPGHARFLHANGEALVLPARHAVSKAVARRAVEHYLEHRALAPFVAWI